MNSEFLENDTLRMFEAQLRRDAEEGRCDFGRVERALLRSIGGAEDEGALALLKLDEIIPGEALERVENGLTKRIERHIEYDMPVDECIKDLRSVHNRYWRYIEHKLNRDIASVSSVPLWEQVLKADEILTLGQWESVEQGLVSTIDDYESANDLVRRSLRTYFGLALSRLTKVRALAVGACACLGLAGGYFVYRDNVTPIPIVLFEAQGARLDYLNRFLPTRGEIRSEKGGSLTFVTTKGYVELQNGSQLIINKASEKNVEYAARFADADNQLIGQGNATFFVKHQKKGQRYTVTTHDYRIEVTGTYFMLQPDWGGHVSTAVREGSVTVVFNNGLQQRLYAGQTLGYDLHTNAYTTVTDGIVVARQDIDQLPDAKDISSYRQLSVTTTPAAGVRVDGRFVGMSPLIIMQPQGAHVVSIEKAGYQTLDTTVTLGAEGPVSITLTLKDTPSQSRIGRQNVLVYTETAVIGTGKAEPRQRSLAAAAGKSVKSAKPSAYNENDFGNAEKWESKNWKEAEELYKQIADNPAAPRLKREAALFSIGKLEAEHAATKAAAKDAFLNYLALYPAGNFVGESWLRLAELEFGADQDKAVEYYLRYFEHYPRHSRISELQYRVGLIYLQKKKYDEAIGMFKLSLANYQNDNAIDKGKIQTSLYKALKEKEDSQNPQPAATAIIEQTAPKNRR